MLWKIVEFLTKEKSGFLCSWRCPQLISTRLFVRLIKASTLPIMCVSRYPFYPLRSHNFLTLFRATFFFISFITIAIRGNFFLKKYWQESEKEKLLKIKKKIEKENTKKRLLNMMNFKYAKGICLLLFFWFCSDMLMSYKFWWRFVALSHNNLQIFSYIYINLSKNAGIWRKFCFFIENFSLCLLKVLLWKEGRTLAYKNYLINKKVKNYIILLEFRGPDTTILILI